MLSKRFAPTALAALVVAAFSAPVALAADPAPAPQAAVKPSGTTIVKLITGIVDSKMVFLGE